LRALARGWQEALADPAAAVEIISAANHSLTPRSKPNG
jgi:hypothetical protein